MIVLIGLNHKTAPLAVREKIFAGCQEEKNLLSHLRSLKGVGEVLYLSTCNRIEIIVGIEESEKTEAVRSLNDFLSRSGGLTEAEAASCIYKYYDEEAVRHIFAWRRALIRSSWARRKFSGR